MPDRIPTVVIVGGGFGGLAVAKALKNAPVQVVLLDRNNHHTFQPLLYQVATGVLSPSHIGSPIRAILGAQRNATVLFADVTGVDKEHRCIFADSTDRQHVSIGYDYLILATGYQHSYFGHDEFESFAPVLKTLADAVATRNKILAAFELARRRRIPPSTKICSRSYLSAAVLLGWNSQPQFRSWSARRSRRVSGGSIRNRPRSC